MRVHILTAGFTSPNGRAFLFPLKVWGRTLADAGIDLRFYREVRGSVVDCDVLIIESKFYSSRWRDAGEQVEAELESLSRRARKLFWFDIADSTGWDHARPLPYVTAWFKNQLLRDRSRYLRPLYGAGRIFADHLYQRGLVEDAAPEWSAPVNSPELLSKLHVGWNSGLADYSLAGPVRMALYGKMPLPGLLQFPRHATRPDTPRTIPVSCRFGLSYARASVAWQRREIARLMGNHLSTVKVGRRTYLHELSQSRLVVSPFGLGEITLKDFECFISGAALVKPAMDHLETWPDFFRPGETMLTHSWEADDLPAVISDTLADEKRRREIAHAGQSLYLRHTTGPDAAILFADRFRKLLAIGG